jgi:hypothetical protein
MIVINKIFHEQQNLQRLPKLDIKNLTSTTASLCTRLRHTRMIRAKLLARPNNTRRQDKEGVPRFKDQNQARRYGRASVDTNGGSCGRV